MPRIDAAIPAGPRTVSSGRAALSAWTLLRNETTRNAALATPGSAT
ncbi:MAG: hypothetical protein ROZ64_04670 [Burkholderiaceae bacterium]|jgi:hypothetical protein|nr:hypothetical protein [Burkholderiaceae bacterium]